MANLFLVPAAPAAVLRHLVPYLQQVAAEAAAILTIVDSQAEVAAAEAATKVAAAEVPAVLAFRVIDLVETPHLAVRASEQA